MKIVHVLELYIDDYQWNGEESVCVEKAYPALVFESVIDAEVYVRTLQPSNTYHIYQVNCYSPGEQVK